MKALSCGHGLNDLVHIISKYRRGGSKIMVENEILCGCGVATKLDEEEYPIERVPFKVMAMMEGR